MDGEDVRGEDGCNQSDGNEEYGGEDRTAARRKTRRTTARTAAARRTTRSIAVRTAVARPTGPTASRTAVARRKTMIANCRAGMTSAVNVVVVLEKQSRSWR